MNTALPVLLLILGGISFWLLIESKLRWYIKTFLISTFCAFTIIFWFAMHSFLGWAANSEDMPEIVNIHWVIVKEPNKILNTKGNIYLLLESAADSEDGSFLDFFGYQSKALEPRLYGLPYSRKLHEQLEKEVMPKLKGGQIAKGRLKAVKSIQGNKQEGDSKKKSWR